MKLTILLLAMSLRFVLVAFDVIFTKYRFLPFKEPPRPPTPPPTFATYTRSTHRSVESQIIPDLNIRLVGSHPLWAHYLYRLLQLPRVKPYTDNFLCSIQMECSIGIGVSYRHKSRDSTQSLRPRAWSWRRPPRSRCSAKWCYKSLHIYTTSESTDSLIE